MRMNVVRFLRALSDAWQKILLYFVVVAVRLLMVQPCQLFALFFLSHAMLVVVKLDANVLSDDKISKKGHFFMDERLAIVE